MVFLASPGNWRLPVLAALGAGSAAYLVTYSSSGLNVAVDLCLLRCVYGFVTGVMVYELRRATVTRVSSMPGALEYVSVALGGVFVTYAGRGPLSLLAPLVFAAVVYVFSFENGPVSRWLQKPQFQALGRRSYSIYMVHASVLMIMLLAFDIVLPSIEDPFFVNPDGERFFTGASAIVADAMLVAYLFATVVLSGLTLRNVEEPGQRIFKGFSERLAVMLKTRNRRMSASADAMAAVPT
jgi:peptidoglycan/LPS O-acetylase OafA/YrhL